MLNGAANRRLPIIEQEEPTIPIVAGDYLADFKCIGPRCEDSCCAGWSCVSVDNDSYRKYQEVTDPEMATMLADKVWFEPAGATENRLCVKLNADTTCPFHTEEKLCKIQQRLGEDYLPTTCQMYPRISQYVHGVLERSAVLSCPEIARLVLLRPEGISFTVQEVKPWRPSSVGGSYDEPSAGSGPIAQHLLSVRSLAIKILQERSLPLGQRLHLFGHACLALSSAVDANSSSLVERYTAAFQGAFQLAAEQPLPPREACFSAQCELLLEFLNDPLYQDRGSVRFKECRNEIREALKLDGRFGSPQKEYRRAYETYYEPFMREHSYILENYLMNHVFKSVFPGKGFISVFDAYAGLILAYGLVKTQLVALSGFHRELTPEIVVKLVQSFSKSFEHRSSSMPEIVRTIRNKSRLNIDYLAQIFGPAEG